MEGALSPFRRSPSPDARDRFRAPDELLTLRQQQGGTYALDDYDPEGGDGGKTLAELMMHVEEAEDGSVIERSAAERDRDYYDGKQLTSDEKAELARRGQPEIIANRIKRKINFLKGLEKQNRTKARCLPRNGEHDQQASDAATDSIRFVCDQNRWDQIRSEVFENILIEGSGAIEFEVQQVHTTDGKVRPKIVLNRIPWDRFLRDPHSRMPDYTDAEYLGTIMWMDRKAAIRKFRKRNPNIEAIIEASYVSNSAGSTYDDRPRSTWTDNRRERVRVVQMWYQTDEGWHWCLFTAGGKIDGGPSPYTDEEGNSLCGIVARSGYVDRENRRYGEVRDMVSPQDEMNKRRSKALHLLTMRQVKYTTGAVDDINVARRELARPDGAIRVNPGGEFEVLETGDLAAGQMNLLQQSANELDLMGPNASMQGKGVSGQSGRAIIAQQQGGVVEASDLLDGLREWSFRVYRMIWWTIKITWDDEMVVRVTDDEDKPRFVVMNRPVTFKEMALRRLQEEAAAQGQEMPPELLQRATQMLDQDPQSGEIATVENAPSEIDVDLVLEEVPDVTTLQQEEFNTIVQLAPAVATMPPGLLEVFIEASTLRNKKKLVEMVKGSAQDQQAQAAYQAKTMETQLQQMIANVEKTISETMKNMAQAGAASAMPGGTTPGQPGTTTGQEGAAPQPGSLSPDLAASAAPGAPPTEAPPALPAAGPPNPQPQQAPADVPIVQPQPASAVELIRDQSGLAVGFRAQKADGSIVTGMFMRDPSTGKITGTQMDDGLGPQQEGMQQ